MLKFGDTSITFGYTAYLEDEMDILVEGHNITVCMDMMTFKKRAIPKWLREKLADYQSRCS